MPYKSMRVIQLDLYQRRNEVKVSRGNFIAGQWIESTGLPFASWDPATGKMIWEGNAATDQEVDAAIAKATQAFDEWSSAPVEERISYLQAFHKCVTEIQDELMSAISQETGKPLWESRGEVTSVAAKIAISIDAYQNRCQEMIRPHFHVSSITRHRPHGVVAVLGPFNFPAHLPNGHIIPALLAGNCIVFKPSEHTPLIAELLIGCWEKAGLPKGVINMIQGWKETGKYLAAHPGIQGLFFTGSANTGLSLANSFATHLEKILALEMGGNNPLVIGKISDFKTVSYLIVQSAFLTSGQRCSCARRLIVNEDANGDRLIEMLLLLMDSITIGPYTDSPEPFMGPVISEGTAGYLLGVQQDLISSGGIPLRKMQHLKEGTGFLSPGLIDMTLVANRSDSEIFGPLLQLIRVPDFAAAIREANQTIYGLSAGLMSDDPEEYRQFYRKIRAGIVNWNSPLTGASSGAPFGGIGMSGNHRPSAYYAADYCAYPVASMEASEIKKPENLTPGIEFPW